MIARSRTRFWRKSSLVGICVGVILSALVVSIPWGRAAANCVAAIPGSDIFDEILGPVPFGSDKLVVTTNRGVFVLSQSGISPVGNEDEHWWMRLDSLSVSLQALSDGRVLILGSASLAVLGLDDSLTVYDGVRFDPGGSWIDRQTVFLELSDGSVWAPETNRTMELLPSNELRELGVPGHWDELRELEDGRIIALSGYGVAEISRAGAKALVRFDRYGTVTITNDSQQGVYIASDSDPRVFFLQFAGEVSEIKRDLQLDDDENVRWMGRSSSNDLIVVYDRHIGILKEGRIAQIAGDDVLTEPIGLYLRGDRLMLMRYLDHSLATIANGRIVQISEPGEVSTSFDLWELPGGGILFQEADGQRQVYLIGIDGVAVSATKELGGMSARGPTILSDGTVVVATNRELMEVRLNSRIVPLHVYADYAPIAGIDEYNETFLLAYSEDGVVIWNRATNQVVMHPVPEFDTEWLRLIPLRGGGGFLVSPDAAYWMDPTACGLN